MKTPTTKKVPVKWTVFSTLEIAAFIAPIPTKLWPRAGMKLPHALVKAWAMAGKGVLAPA